MPQFIQSGYCNAKVASVVTQCASASLVVRVQSQWDGKQPLPFSGDLRLEKESVAARTTSSDDPWRIEQLTPGRYRLSVYPTVGSLHHDYRHVPLDETFSTTVDIGANETIEVSAWVSRKESIIFDIPYTFRVTENPSANDEPPYIEWATFSEVSENATAVASASKRFAVPPGLINSVIYLETTHGWYDAIPSAVGLNKSLRPMNVHAAWWRTLFGREYLAVSENNVHAGTFLLQRILTRKPGASTAAVASVYNDTNAAIVSNYGARLARIEREKLFIPPARLFDRIRRDVQWFESLSPAEQVWALRRMFGMADYR